MGMTREEELDWLYRLRSEIYVYMPKEWLIPMNDALDMAIKALEQGPTTKNDLEIVMDAMEYRTNALIENIKSEIMHFTNAHCSGNDINIYDVLKVIDDCCEVENSTTKNDLGVDCISRADAIRVASGYCHPSNVAKELANLPSVTPQEPRKGHWIDCDNSDDYSADGYDCSVCGVNSEYVTSYCPNCGAKMGRTDRSVEDAND